MKAFGLDKLLLAAALLTVMGACAADADEGMDDLSEVSALDSKVGYAAQHDQVRRRCRAQLRAPRAVHEVAEVSRA